MGRKFIAPLILSAALLGGVFSVTSCSNDKKDDETVEVDKSTIFGVGAPDGIAGNDGQIYINTENGDKYIYTGGWAKVVATRLQGEGEPESTIGKPGDEYIDTTTNIIYRKVDNETWQIFSRPEVPDVHTITFDLDGGFYGKDPIIEAQKIEDGKWASEPQKELMNKRNCVFLGWYDGDNLFNFRSPVYGDVNLKAKWEVNEEQKVVLEIDPANGEKPYKIETFLGESPRIKVPTKEGYDFVGWYILETNEPYPGYINADVAGNKLVAHYEKARFNFKYEVTPEGEITITGVHRLDTKRINVPNTIDGKPVTTVANGAFSGKVSLNEVYLGKNVKNFSARAVSGARNLTGVFVDPENPNFLDIDGYVYTKDSTKLVYVPSKVSEQSLKIPATVKTIGEYACYGHDAYGITSIDFNEGLETIEQYAFGSNTGLNSLQFPSTLKTIGDSAFSSFEGMINRVNFNEGLESIGEFAFANQYISDAIVLPSTVKHLGFGAFAFNKSVKKVTLSAALETIDNNPFIGMYGLQKITIPTSNKNFEARNNILYTKDLKTVVIVPAQMFQDEFQLIEGIEKIGDYAFHSANRLTKIELPETLISIGAYAFSDCFGLTSINIPNSVTSIGEAAFNGCKAATSITIGSGLKAIPQYAFQNCYGVKDLVIPSNVKTIDKFAFFGLNSITNLTISEGVESIGDLAFAYVPPYDESVPTNGESYLKSITFPNSLTTLGEEVFRDHTILDTITVGTGLQTLSRDNIDTNVKIKAIRGLKDHPYLKLVENVLYSKDSTKVLMALDSVNKEFVSIQSGAVEICPSAFRNVKVEEVIFPSTVEKIDSYAFANTAIKSLDLPESLTTIDEYGFYSCDQLTTITFNNKLETIGAHAFVFAQLQTLAFPNSLKTIGEGAFTLNTLLENITFGNKFESLGDGSFDRCPKLNCVVKLPATLKYFGLGVFTYNNITAPHKINDIIIDKACAAYESKDGMVLTKDGKKVVAYATGSKNSEIVIPSTVEEICDYAFYAAYNIKKLTLPESLKTIGTYALAYCQGIETFNIPASVTFINERAFAGAKLTSTIIFNCTYKDALTRFSEGYLNDVLSEVTVVYSDSETEEQ